GPAGGVVFFLFGEPKEDVFPFTVALAIGQMLVGGRRFDLAPPHPLDGCKVGLIDGHRASSLIHEPGRRARRAFPSTDLCELCVLSGYAQFAMYPLRARTR